MNTKTYTFSLFNIIFTLLLVFLFVSAFIPREFQPSRLWVYISAPIVGLCIWLFLLPRGITVDEHGIASNSLFRHVHMAWAEVTRLYPRLGSSFQIENADGSKAIYLSAQISGYGQLVGAVLRMAPAAQSSQLRSFHIQPYTPLLVLAVAIAAFAFGIHALAQPGFQLQQLFLVLGAVIVLILIRLPHSIHLLPTELHVKSLTGSRFYPRTEIEAVVLRSRLQRSGTKLFVQIELKNRKKIEFASLSEGALPMFVAVDEWLK